MTRDEKLREVAAAAAREIAGLFRLNRVTEEQIAIISEGCLRAATNWQREQHNALFKELCEEWNEDCEPGCDSVAHDEACGYSSLTVAKRNMRLKIERQAELMRVMEAALTDISKNFDHLESDRTYNCVVCIADQALAAVRAAKEKL